MNTRYINNKKVLFIEELQSDLHTQGAKKGYRTKQVKSKTSEKEGKISISIQDPNAPSSVIDAPYKGFDWVSLALKRILRHGAENNFDEIAFINSDQIIDRWDLSKKVKYLAYDKRDIKGQPRLTVRGVDIDGKDFNLGVLETPQKLESLLGKGVVDKMLKGDGLKGGRGAKSTRASFAQKYETVLEGDDLKIKSRYMIDLYTNQIPQRLKKLTKKLWAERPTSKLLLALHPLLELHLD